MMTSTLRAFAAHRNRTFLWLGGSRREVFDALYEGLARGASLVVLTGDVGAGKTMLAEAVAARLADEGALVGRLLAPTRDADDVWTGIVAAFGLGTDAPGRDVAAARFARLVRRAAATSTRVLLVIDEAQSLPGEALRELMSVCEAAADAGASGTVGVLLVGADALTLALARPELAALAARTAVRRRLPALRPPEVAAYVRHRLACADAPREIVTPDGLTALARLSGGVPRLVDVLAARAAARGRVVDSAIVERCAKEVTWLVAVHSAGADRAPRWPQRPRTVATLAAGVVIVALAGAALVGLRVSGSEQVAHGTDVAASAMPPAARTSRHPSPEPPAARAAADDMNEPDPRAIIDWLLSRPPGPGAGGH